MRKKSIRLWLARNDSGEYVVFRGPIKPVKTRRFNDLPVEHWTSPPERDWRDCTPIFTFCDGEFHAATAFRLEHGDCKRVRFSVEVA